MVREAEERWLASRAQELKRARIEQIYRDL
jgi:hypothetical protein